MVTSVGLIISTYNWPAALDRVLASVVEQSCRPAQVIVADDGSGPETAAVVARWAAVAPFPIEHVWQEDDGFRLSRIRNLALARSTAEYLIFTDGDQVLPPDFLFDHRRAARPGAVVRGSRIFLSAERTAEVLSGGALPRWWRGGVGKRAAAIRIPWLASLLLPWRGRGTQGHTLAVWRSDALRVNGFDERFVGWGGEDADFVIRLLHAGLVKHRLRFAGAVYHLDHPYASRAGQSRNDAIYFETERTRRIRAVVGLAELGSTGGPSPTAASPEPPAA